MQYDLSLYGCGVWCSLCLLRQRYATTVASQCHGLSVYPVCVCNTVRLGQVRSRHNLKPSGTRFECVSGLSV